MAGELAQRIQQASQEVFSDRPRLLYPALHRLEYKGWIQADWKASENNRKAKYYALTRTGKKQLEAEIESWDRLAGAVALVLNRLRKTHAQRVSRTPALLHLRQELR